jgi:hypothetical protein
MAYESLTIPNFMASQPPLKIRVVRSAHGKDGMYSIGRALDTVSWTDQGFITLSQSENPVAIPLQFTSSLGFSELTYPRSILLDGRIAYIAGNGFFTPFGGTKSGSQPTIAVVDTEVWSCFVQVGNGDVLENEEYNDVQANPCDPDTLYVCGKYATSPSIAIIRKVSRTSFMPLILGTSGQLYTSLTYVNENANAVSMAIASSKGLRMIVVAVQLETSSMIWPLDTDGVNLPSPSLTSFNLPLTGKLRLPAGVTAVTLIKILVSTCGSVKAVGTGVSDPMSATLPPSVTVSYDFNFDTEPNLYYGVDGIATWWNNGQSARACDACLTVREESLFIVGNSFTNENSGSGSTTIEVPCLPWLSVTTILDASPIPFLIRQNDVGSTCVLLYQMKGEMCSAFAWASSFRLTSILGGVIMGDVSSKPLEASQPAGLLTVHMVNLRNTQGDQNCKPVQVPIITSSCAGVVEVDNRCEDTTLVVNGPVVVGNGAPALPGAIRFNAGAFEGYIDDTIGWLPFSML